MKRIGYNSLAMLAACAMTAVITTASFATPQPTSAVVNERVFNDCGLSTLSSINSFPGSISFSDDWSDLCIGFANRHNWRFSENGTTSAVFGNNNDFTYSAVLNVSGTGACEAGIEIAPWYSEQAGGRLQVRIPDGEIAAFDHRLPFYSFSNPATHNLRYTGGDITLKFEYHENGLNAGSPATIEYTVIYNGNTYSSGPIAFDEGNVAEGVIYGNWGILTPAYVGGMVQTNNGTPPPAEPDGTPDRTYDVSFNDIQFQCLDCVTPANATSWGRIKSIYR